MHFIVCQSCFVDQLDKDKWKSEIVTKPKLRFYRKFKDKLCLEPYVNMHISSKERSYLAQLRFGILPINVEIGRYRSIPLNNRLCTLCELNQIEDECHILFYCEKYKSERRIWLQKLDILEEDINVIREDLLLERIFSSPRITAKFIVNIMTIRQKTIFSIDM